MMQNLRLVLIIVGAIAIIALLWHGLWINRKERSSFFERRSAKRQQQEYVDPLKNSDEDVGEVRVRSSHEQERPALKQHKHSINTLQTKPTSPPFQSARRKQPLSEPGAYQVSSAKKNRFEELKSIIRQDPLTESTEPVKSSPSEEWVSEPRPVAPLHHSPSQARQEPAVPLEANRKEVRNERVLILHIAAHHGCFIEGALLLQGLHKMGFQFGEMGIFHRHLRPGIKSPVLFSLANMIKPGSFNPDKMSDFETPGVSIFMILPSYGNDYQNLELMLQTAQRLAHHLDALVLDDEHRLMTPQKLEGYKTRIRETLDA